MKKLNYIFIDMESILNQFNLFQTEFDYDNFLFIMESMNNQLFNSHSQVYLFYPTNQVLSRKDEYLKIYHQLREDIIQKYPQLKTDIDNVNEKKLMASLADDDDKLLILLCLRLRLYIDKSDSLNIERFNYQAFHQCLVDSFNFQVKPLGLNKNNNCYGYSIDDIIVSAVMGMNDYCEKNNIDLNIAVLSASRSLMLTSLLPNVSFFRSVRNKVGWGLNLYDKDTFLYSFLQEYQLSDTGELKSYLEAQNSFYIYDKILKQLELFILGINNQSNKFRIPLKNFGIKKFDNICFNYISPNHLLNHYEDLDNKTKKQLPLKVLEYAVQIVNVAEFKQVSTKDVFNYLKNG